MLNLYNSQSLGANRDKLFSPIINIDMSCRVRKLITLKKFQSNFLLLYTNLNGSRKKSDPDMSCII